VGLLAYWQCAKLVVTKLIATEKSVDYYASTQAAALA